MLTTKFTMIELKFLRRQFTPSSDETFEFTGKIAFCARVSWLTLDKVVPEKGRRKICCFHFLNLYLGVQDSATQ